MIYTIINRSRSTTLPLASQVLNSYLKQQNYPHWTSYFVKYKDCVNDQFGQSYFINKCPEKPHWRYLILRTGCFPFMKYHCTRLDPNMIIDEKQIKFQNGFFNLIKLINLGTIFTVLNRKIVRKTKILYFF